MNPTSSTEEHIEQLIDIYGKLPTQANRQRIMQLILAREEVLKLETEIKIHDEYWHSQRFVEEYGIGPLALANKEATELQLRNIQSQPTTKESE